jgi:CubicO group peptidase (beta-lactamase class C family)
MAEIHGSTVPGFEKVKDAFAANFDSHGEVGAAFSAYVRGEKVVDLWGGMADAATNRPYERDTLQMVFSTTKGATAICANQLIEQGLLDPDAPVAAYWPEFAQAGKEEIPVRMILCHQAGLPVIDETLTLDETLSWDPVIAALEVQEPIWEPGTKHGYHAVTYGYLVGEVVRRITGQSLGAYFAEHVAAPLDLEFWIGLPDEQYPRVAPLLGIELPNENVREMARQLLGQNTLLGRALSAPSGVFSNEDGMLDVVRWNEARVLGAEIPAANGVCTARSLARMYAATIGEVDGVRVLGEDQRKRAVESLTTGPDQVMFFESKFGLGFMLSSAFSPYGGPNGFGHAGAGGSVGFADPDVAVGFGYVMNQMTANLVGDPRTVGLTESLYEAVGSIPHVF